MTEHFGAAIHSAGLEPPDVIEPDGKIYRFASNGKRGDDAGWYVYHGDGIPADTFGDWRTNIRQLWRAYVGRPLMPTEEAAHKAKVEVMKREREAEKARRRSETATKAASIWKAVQPVQTSVTRPSLSRRSAKEASGVREVILYQTFFQSGGTDEHGISLGWSNRATLLWWPSMDLPCNRNFSGTCIYCKQKESTVRCRNLHAKGGATILKLPTRTNGAQHDHTTTG